MDISREKQKFHKKRAEHGLLNENLKKETESLLIAAQNDTIRTNYIKVEIDNLQHIVSVGYVLTKMKLLMLKISAKGV